MGEIKAPDTPMWKQYVEIKSKAQDALLFYRMGDFYELFFDDAVIASEILGITLTARNRNEPEPVPMCGVPFHSATNYINKLLEHGKRVAICEQMEEAGAGKKLVRREIVRIVSPGMAFDNETLASDSNNFLLSLELNEGFSGSFAALDLSTGEFTYSNFSNTDELQDELSILCPREIIIALSFAKTETWKTLKTLVGEEYFSCVTPILDFYFSKEAAFEELCRHFQVLNLEGFGLSKESFALGVLGAALRMSHETQKQATLTHLQAPRMRDQKKFLQLDESTMEHLELNSLFLHLNKCSSAMGARKLREWIMRPLRNLDEITERQNAIAQLITQYPLQEKLRSSLQGIRDLERLTTKIGLGNASPRDLAALRDALGRIPKIKETLKQFVNVQLLQKLNTQMEDFSNIVSYLELRLREELPAFSREGHIFKAGWHKDLDELLALSEHGHDYILKLEATERERTSINSLKIKFNNVFGYYIDITKTNLALVPENYIRKQTTASGERFITEELKRFEEKMLHAEEKRIALEQALFTEALNFLSQYSQAILHTAQQLAVLDVLLTLAKVAQDNRYHCPVLNYSSELFIEAGRHPILEKILGADQFIANDIYFNELTRLFIVTGPNMSGKSTFMRQIALLTLMSQMGSFIPAKSARIGIVDRIATRVGASDRIARGQSTFMVEMNEMAKILRHSTERSLLIIDEIGRGTSTYDGLALAWAIAEDILVRLQARTLFATHYHEMTVLEEHFAQAKNLCVAIEEVNGKIVFLHKVKFGKAQGSYGIEVAKLAGLPNHIVQRANEILSGLEKQSQKRKTTQKLHTSQHQEQMPLFLV